MIISVPIPVTRRSLVVDREFIVAADRDKMLNAARQTFDELGMKVHKQDSSEMIHWPGGFGRATKVVATLVDAAECFYQLTFQSLGIPGQTQLGIKIKMPYGKWFHAREKAEQKIVRFIERLEKVSAEHGISYKSK